MDTPIDRFKVKERDEESYENGLYITDDTISLMDSAAR